MWKCSTESFHPAAEVKRRFCFFEDERPRRERTRTYDFELLLIMITVSAICSIHRKSSMINRCRGTLTEIV